MCDLVETAHDDNGQLPAFSFQFLATEQKTSCVKKRKNKNEKKKYVVRGEEKRLSGSFGENIRPKVGKKKINKKLVGKHLSKISRRPKI